MGWGERKRARFLVFPQPPSIRACLQTIYTFFYAVVGTLRPDLIESASSLASSKADAIKTHHNDTELVRNLRAKVSTQKS